ncbi:hypothetical protein MKW98_002324 [Papaver atlanticum]|uniref:protein-serine/threonine phosphatase n=1 Tax=Papaver atlanticum TaxID=357466 RepID=A0AAD4RUS2_9MAGN|nr:hypothetical protein MKW98_002324 [Papaver atlanticum]
MGNGCGKLGVCFSGGNGKNEVIITPEPYDEGLGHSFCYVRPTNPCPKIHSSEEESTIFRSISGASVSANTSTPLSTSFIDLYSYNNFIDRASVFESSNSFTSIPLQPIPKYFLNSMERGNCCSSGPLEKGFFSGPSERGFMSAPLERGVFSGPIDKKLSDQFQTNSYFHEPKKLNKGCFVKNLKRAISKRISGSRSRKPVVAPVDKGAVSVKELDWIVGSERNVMSNELTISSTTNLSSDYSLDSNESYESQNVQWAQGKAGEDRIQVVISEEHGWVFVGIYDGFNGPDATDYLLTNLYPAVHKELKGLLWEDNFEEETDVANSSNEQVGSFQVDESERTGERLESCSQCVDDPEKHPSRLEEAYFHSKLGRGKNSKRKLRGALKNEEIQRRWKCEWDRERMELDRKLKEGLNRSSSEGMKNVNHPDVLKALSRALEETEEAYLDIADKMFMKNPELALMGSCLLVMLMKGEDVYLMNVGDSRAVLANKPEPDIGLGKTCSDLDQIKEETQLDLQSCDEDQYGALPALTAHQLTTDHSTSEAEEVQRIKNEHPDDSRAIVNDRVKGSLKVTRAFGAGFLKQPKWNNALLQVFRIDFVGSSPYINCLPSLYHHRLGHRDRFLILSSDGLYQYFTNEEAVSEVESFITSSPDGDPAQHLIEGVMFRAARRAGLDFHELLEIPQGDRRRYHDDVSVIVISFEGRIWRSCA